MDFDFCLHVFYTGNTPLMKPTLTWWGGFQSTRVQQSASTGRAQLSIAVTTIRLNGSSLLLYQDLSQYWLYKIRKTLREKCPNTELFLVRILVRSETFFSKSKHSRCSVGFPTLPLFWVRIAPEVSEEEGICASHFLPLAFFRKFIRVVFYFSWLC